MKILHICNNFNETMGYQDNILPQYQFKYADKVTVIVPDLLPHYNKKRKKEPGEFYVNGVKIIRINTRGEFKGRFVIFKNLLREIENEKPDYIFHHGVTAPSLFTASRYKQLHPDTFLAADNHADLNISGKNSIWKSFYYNFLWKNILKKYDRYIDLYFGVTPLRNLFLEEELNINPEKIRLLPIGADIDNANIDIEEKIFLNHFNLDDNVFTIVHGGKMSSEKETFKIIEAFRRIKRNDIRLILFGTINDEKIRNSIQKDSRIIFLGWLNRKDTLSLLRHADIGIWNKLHTTLLEDCIAVGLPMIVRYYGSTCHLIDNTGLFLYDGSQREIQDNMQFILDNLNILKDFKKNIDKHRSILSYDAIAKESIQYYYSLEKQKIHNTFISDRFIDLSYEHYRKI